MDFLALVSGDNIFKYSFTLGVVMVIFSLVYPLQKQHAIEIEILTYNKEIKLLNNEINILYKSVLEQKKISESLKNKPKKQLRNIKDSVIEFNEKLNTAEKERQRIEIKKIVLDFSKSKIAVLQSQADTFGNYSSIMRVIGIILSVFGFVFWLIKTFKDWKRSEST